MLSSDDVKAEARALGFDLCGVAPAGTWPELAFYRKWLDRGFAGEMAYLARTADRRADVRRVLPSARSVVVVGAIYNTGHPASIERADPRVARIARYAWGDDYHEGMGGALDRLTAWMRARAGAGFEARAYVDTGPVQERVYAQYAGLGWIGRNTCLINPEVGSWLLLGEVISNAALEPDAPGLDQCGTCTLCLEACPTGALVEPHVLDATRCQSYLTIELKGAIPVERRGDLGAHVFGCDICQDVCPWNQTPATGRTDAPEWQPRPGLDGPPLVDLWRRSDDELRALMKGSPLARPGLRGLRRNLAVALGNSGDPVARDALDAPGDRPSAADRLVEEHVDWARRRLAETRRGEGPSGHRTEP